jgi:hypothetical protein
LDLRGAVELIASIEEEFDVNGLIHRGMHAWPVVRFQLFDDLWRLTNPPRPKEMSVTAREPVASSLLDRLWHQVQSEFEHLRKTRRGRALERKLLRSSQLDILFHSRREDHADWLSKRFGRVAAIDRFLDPLISVARQRYRVLKVEPLTEGVGCTLPRWHRTIFYDLRNLGPGGAQAELGEPVNLGEFTAYLGKRVPSLAFDATHALRRLEWICIEQPRYRRVLERLRPRCVLLVCYYTYHGLAMLRACHDMGIPAVDVQHGHGGAYNPFQTHWTRVPAGGYALLPRYFWTWGRASSEHIERWLPVHATSPRTVEGGNLWLTGWRTRLAYPVPSGTRRLLRSLAGARKVVVVSLQPIHDLIPAHVMQAIRGAPRDWCWLVRLHPHSRDRVGEVKSSLARAGVNNALVEEPTVALLYPLLRRADHHVTCWSTVCYEALAMGVPTTLVHETARQLYQGYIDQGVFILALDVYTLLSSINERGRDNPGIERDPYICTEPLLAEKALRDLVDGDAFG